MPSLMRPDAPPLSIIEASESSTVVGMGCFWPVRRSSRSVVLPASASISSRRPDSRRSFLSAESTCSADGWQRMAASAGATASVNPRPLKLSFCSVGLPASRNSAADWRSADHRTNSACKSLRSISVSVDSWSAARRKRVRRGEDGWTDAHAASNREREEEAAMRGERPAKSFIQKKSRAAARRVEDGAFGRVDMWKAEEVFITRSNTDRPRASERLHTSAKSSSIAARTHARSHTQVRIYYFAGVVADAALPGNRGGALCSCSSRLGFLILTSALMS